MTHIQDREFVYFFDERSKLKATAHLPEEVPFCGEDQGWKPRLYYGKSKVGQHFVSMQDMKPVVNLQVISPNVSLDKFSYAYRTLQGGLMVAQRDVPRDTTSSVVFSLEEYTLLCDIVKRF